MEYAGEAAVKKAVTVIKKEVRDSNDILPRAKIVIAKFLDTLVDFIPFIQTVHRGLFYLYGNKYQLSKRLTGINYVRSDYIFKTFHFNTKAKPQVLVRYWLKQDHSVLGYKILGVITLLQAFISVTLYLRRTHFAKTQSKQQTDQVSRDFGGIQSRSGKICVLCMDVRTNVSAIRCGHMFCYYCILDWLKTKNECPVCRDPAKPSNVVFLSNYQGVWWGGESNRLYKNFLLYFSYK